MEINIKELGENYAHIQVGDQDLYVEIGGKGIDYIEVSDEEWKVTERFSGGETAWAPVVEEPEYEESYDPRTDYLYDMWKDERFDERHGELSY